MANVPGTKEIRTPRLLLRKHVKGITIHGESDESRGELAEKISQALTEAGITNLTERMYEFYLLLFDAKNLERTTTAIRAMGYEIEQ